MPLWKMEQITPYFEKVENRAKHDIVGVKLVKDCLTNSEVGTINLMEAGGSYEFRRDGEFQKEKFGSPTIIANTVAKVSPVYRDDNPDIHSYEKAAKALYKVYWRHLSFWGKLHRLAYKWSLPMIAVTLVLILIEVIALYLTYHQILGGTN